MRNRPVTRPHLESMESRLVLSTAGHHLALAGPVAAQVNLASAHEDGARAALAARMHGARAAYQERASTLAIIKHDQRIHQEARILIPIYHPGGSSTSTSKTTPSSGIGGLFQSLANSI